MFDGLSPGWLWAIGGILLLIAEVLAPGFFLIFLGLAAIATGAFTLLFDLSLGPQLALFVIYTALAVMIGKRWYAMPGHSEHRLNDPAKRMIGRVVTVVDAIGEHGGRVRVGDGEWSARGHHASVGEQVRVTGVEGNCLLVESDRGLSETTRQE